MFSSLMSRNIIIENQLKYFKFHGKVQNEIRQNFNTNQKTVFLPKIHKRLDSVPGRPVISNYGAPTEKVSEFCDFNLKPVMQKGNSYIKDSTDVMRKRRNTEIHSLPNGAILVTVDVVGLYPNIPHEAGLDALKLNWKRGSQKLCPLQTF